MATTAPPPIASRAQPASIGFKPYVSPGQSPAEFTLKAIVIGVAFGLIFGASTVYLGLRAGLTVSASIPIAVLAISVLKKLGGSTILENNIVQTIGSAGESVAGGVVFTIPALIFLTPRGPEYFNYYQITVLALVGGILGVLMMVPLRRALIVKEHGVLPYPEGAACADVLIAGERGGALAATVFKGLAVVDRADRPHCRRLQPGAQQLLSQRDAEHRYLARVHGRRLRHRTADCRRHVCGRRAVVAGVAAAAVDHGQLHDRAISTGAGQRPAHRPDERAAVVERIHPLHRGRRGAGFRHHHALPDDSDHRVVVPRQHEGFRRRTVAGGEDPYRARPPAVHRARRLAPAGDLPRGRAADADPGQFPRVAARDHLRLLLRHRLVAHHRPHRFVVEPDLGDDDRDADPDVHDLRRARLDRRLLLAGRDLCRRHRLHRVSECRRHLAGS